MLVFPATVWALLWADPDNPPTVGLVLSLIPVVGLTFFSIGLVTKADGFLRRLMAVALFAKLTACAVYIFVITNVYNYVADAFKYWSDGILLAEFYEHTHHWKMLYPLWSNNLIFTINGGLVTVFGSSFTLGMVIYATVGFWGQFLLYRAFEIAYPTANRRLAAVLIFLTPSLLYWSSSVGKDSAILLALGATVYGLASIMNGSGRRGAAALVLGLIGTTMVRPHIGAIVVVSLAGPYLLTRFARGPRGWIVKTISIPILVLTTFLIVREAQQFLFVDDLSGASRVIDLVGKNNHIGDSAIGVQNSMSTRVILAPFFFFRPFPWEVRNPQGMIAAVEGILLLAASWRQRRHLRQLVRTWRENTFTLFLLLFVTQFAVIFSAALSNFGLLVRERVMAMPFFLMLLCIPVAPAVRKRAPLPSIPMAWPDPMASSQ